jgi:ElaB/YqjD/DUF883 family membrane-anchored ribosome-binding protein
MSDKSYAQSGTPPMERLRAAQYSRHSTDKMIHSTRRYEMDANTRAVDIPLENDAHDTSTRQHGAKALYRSKDKLLVDLKAVVEDAQALMKEAVDSSAESVAGVPAYLDDRLSAVKDNLQRVKGAMADQARHAAAATDQYVRENPWRSIGVATAASVVISLLLVRATLPALGKMRGAGKS